MTNEQKLKGLQMLIDGASYSDVARDFGVSRERIRQMYSNLIGSSKKKAVYRKERAVYPALENWMIEHDCSVSELAEKLGIHFSTVSEFLNGKRYFKIKTLTKLLKVTGLTYEDLYMRGDEE